jgi:hypothetical protein
MYGIFKQSVETMFFLPNLRVHFTTADPRRLPVLSAIALRIHSCIARILDESGIAEQLNQMLLEDDRFNHNRFLNSDGSIDGTTLNNSILLRLYRKQSKKVYASRSGISVQAGALAERHQYTGSSGRAARALYNLV